MESDDFTRHYIIRYLSAHELVLPPLVPTSLVLVQKQAANTFVTTKMHHYTVDEI